MRPQGKEKKIRTGVKQGGRIGKVLGGVLILALVGAAFFLYYSGNNKTEHVKIPKGTGPAFSRHNWVPGVMQSYRLSIASDVRLGLPGSKSLQPIIQRLSGTLNMRVFGMDDGRVRVGFQLQPATFTVNGQPDEGMEGGLSAPFLAVFEENGRPHSFRFPDVLKREERIILEEAVRTFQVVFSDKDHSSWTVSEDHATGRYLAHYQAQQDGSLRKQKTLYTEVNIPSGGDKSSGDPRIQLRKSATAIRISPETAWIRNATVEERLIMTGGVTGLTESVTKAELAIISTSSDRDVALFGDGDAGEMLQAFSRKPLRPESGEDTAEKVAESSSETGEELFTQLVDQLNGAERPRIALLKHLEKLLRDHPELAFRLIETIEGPGIKGGTAARLIHALELAETPEAQQALVMVMEDPSFRAWNRIRAIVALGDVETATDEALTSLLNTSRNRSDVENVDRANTAMLAIGSIGRSLREATPDRAGRISDELTMGLQGAGDPSETEVTLKALGNTGDPALAGAIIPYLDDPSPFVRAAAARALGSIEADASLDLLTDRLMVEEDRRVRSAIAAGMEDLGTASFQSLDAVNGMIFDEPNANTRYRMAKHLGDNLATYPAGMQTLQRLVITDRSSRVRKYAAAVLLAKRNQ